MYQYKFLRKCADSQGNVRSEEVMAENAQAAREKSTGRGLTELELRFEDIARRSEERSKLWSGIPTTR